MNSLRLLTAGILVCSLLPGCEEPPPSDPLLETIKAQNEYEDIERARRDQEKRDAFNASRKVEQAVASDVPQEGVFVVEFTTDKGNFQIEVHRDWAPIGADRVYKLVKDEFFDGAGFFRVMPGFMVQFGLAADPAKTEKWSKNLFDEPVVKSNKPGYVSFAKTNAPNSRSTQIFINYGDNARSLDPQGFAPFGKVISGMDVVSAISSAHGEDPVQQAITMRGSAYLKEAFPKLDFINTARIIKDDTPEEEDPGEGETGEGDEPADEAGDGDKPADEAGEDEKPADEASE